jgi:hypothetical protein
MEIGNQIDPPHSSQKHKKGAIAVTIITFLGTDWYRIGDSPTKKIINARIGRQYNSLG